MAVCTKEGPRESNLRVTSGLDEVDAGVNTVVGHLETVNAVLLLEVGVITGLDVVDDGLPAAMSVCTVVVTPAMTHHSSLLTKSPKPGVSTTVSLRRTPFSSISVLRSVRVWVGRCARVSGPNSRPRSALTSANRLDVDSLATVRSGLGDNLGLVKFGLEKSVDERRLAETRLACAHCQHRPFTTMGHAGSVRLTYRQPWRRTGILDCISG